MSFGLADESDYAEDPRPLMVLLCVSCSMNCNTIFQLPHMEWSMM